ncbi:MAG: DUF262 domain-containing protein [Candidatus Methanomethylophilaceae archaeon]|nr:DUF262 domain-containing protein [Candidatus Methanomethylophilaceae archaeon]
MTKAELIKMAEHNPSAKSENMSMQKMCDYMNDNKLVVPAYQRDMVWTLPKCVDLLNFQLLAKPPVSAISMNMLSEENEVAQYSFITRRLVCGKMVGAEAMVDKLPDVKYPLYSIIDGQQRLTTNLKAYNDDPDFNKVVLDVSYGKFKIVDNIDVNQFPVGKLYNKDYKVFYDYMNEHFDPKDHSLLNAIRNKFLGYTYHVNYGEDLDLDEQVEWFYKLNNAGTTVSDVQLSISKLKLKGFDVYAQYVRPFNQQLKDADLFDTISQAKAATSVPIACLNAALERISGEPHKSNYSPIPSDAKTSSLGNLLHNEVMESFDMTLKALSEVIEFYDRIGYTPYRVEQVTFLVGYFVLIDDRASDRELENWVRSTDFRDKTNSDKRKIYSDLLEL